MKTKATILLLAAMAAANVSAQTTQRLNATKINEYALIYTLPSTRINVTLEAKKTVKEPGEFFRYAKKYLGMEPITAASTTYSLESATLSTSGVADLKEQYQVQFKAGTTPYIMINENNFPLSINTEAINPEETVELPKAVEAKPTILQTPAAKQAVTAEMLQSPSSAKRAELAAARIYELRQNRSDILSGSADQMPADGQAMKLVLDNLAAQEEALTAMFLGTTQTSTEVRTYTVKPSQSDSTMVVARLSAVDGLVNADNLGGDPIYLNIKISERGKLPVNEKGEEKRFPKGGFAYRIPGAADLTVTFMGKDICSKNVKVADYGVVFGLDPNIFTDKKAPAYATFMPSTGAITELGVATVE